MSINIFLQFSGEKHAGKLQEDVDGSPPFY
jgi:hypothetical protein